MSCTVGRPSHRRHGRSRTDRVDSGGQITLRYAGRPSSIGFGRNRVLILVQNLEIRIIDAATGDLLRALWTGTVLSA